MSEVFDMVAKTFQGLEGVLADELRQLGAESVKEGIRMVRFKGDKAMMYKANYCCRTAVRVLKPFLEFEAHNADELYEVAKAFEWDTVMTKDCTFAIDPTIISDEFLHSRFVTYRVKDAIADYFMNKYGERPSVLVSNPQLQFNVHISGKRVTFSLDSSGESLHKRGYRVATNDAPINEVLAAGILRLAGWEGQCDLYDPMCGSGTFLVEAALMAANIYPGVCRSQGYAFEKWADFDAELFAEIAEDDSQEREFTHKIYGSDLARQAIDITQRNVKSAGVSRWIELECKDFFDIETLPFESGMVVTNPPYGERLSVEKIEEFYRQVGHQFKHKFAGCDVWVIGYKKEHFDAIGLTPSAKMAMYNGDLECELRQYKIFSGKFSELRERGEHIKNENFRRPDRDRKPPRKSDGDGKRFEKKDGDGKRFDKKDGDRKRFEKKDGEHKRFDKKDGEGKRFENKDRDGKRPYGRRDGDKEERGGKFKKTFNERRERNFEPRQEAPRGPQEPDTRTEEEKLRDREIKQMERELRERSEAKKGEVREKKPRLDASTEVKLGGQRRNSWKKNKE